ncbi:acetyl-CoA C-acyltransferase [Marinobacterium litorale]|uniref:acetyl-CoA C-acyltransferase n=1 Tax=Marinobacterium litorale TaxID=404770 RepID=UPI0004051766|nr:acetyl-CoA C-acyltransferase [Marinobacterium litorale]
MNPVYLTDYKRTAFTRAHPKKTELDDFAELPADHLLARLIDNALERNSLDPSQVDDLSIGCALAVREQWSFGGRYPVLESRLGDQCASRQIDQQCGSGMAAIRFSMLNIASGACDIAFAGGYENMTRIPMGPSLFQDGTLTVPPIPADNGKSYAMDTVMNMGLTAERLAAEAGIGRERMDRFALRSHQRAARARDEGLFHREILPIERLDGSRISTDANVRGDTSLERLAELKPAFSETGQVSAGNSSPLTSGAALAVLMSESALKNSGSEPLAKVLGCVDRGVKPELMGQGVVPAVERLLNNAGLRADQIDLWEINEAFSVVPLYAIDRLGLEIDRVNIHGGALALGHPLGATGVRLVGTLAHNLKQTGGRYGVAAACIGGGQGIAMLIDLEF